MKYEEGQNLIPQYLNSLLLNRNSYDLDFQFIYKVVMNGKTYIHRENYVPVALTDVKVYAADPWYPPADGKIRNLVINTQEDCLCICGAASCSKG